MSDIEQRLAELERLGLDRRLRLVSGPQGPRVLLDEQPVLLLCSNNYLGLADHPRVREAAAEAAMRWGVSAGASRLVSGTMTIHRRLEQRLAAWEGSEQCLLFGSGYLANIGTIGALAGVGDVVFSDELNHASIVDGCRCSRAEVVVYRHLDTEHLAWSLGHHGGGSTGGRSGDGSSGSSGGSSSSSSGSGSGSGSGSSSSSKGHDRGGDGRRRLIVTDSVFSMDGDIAPLAEIVALAKEHGARVMVDEAHATGALGPGGRGAVAAAGLEGEVDVLVGTLGKALGSYGAYVCAEEETIRYLINTSRSLIFSTAPGPPAVAGALAALELLEADEDRVEQLHSAARTLRGALALEGFPVAAGDMHIVPLLVGDAESAMRLCGEALQWGVFAQAIRPPTVPPGTSRLRLAAMATHTAEDLVMAARALGEAAREIGLDPAAIGSSPSVDQPAMDERKPGRPAPQAPEPDSPVTESSRESHVAHAA